MKIIKANVGDFEEIAEFYKFVIANSPSVKRYCPWIYGLHPSDEMIMGYITGGEMILCRESENGKIIGALGFMPRQDEEYHSVKWKNNFADNEVATIHILCVHHDFARRGIATLLVSDAISEAKRLGKRAVRLDAHVGNTPAIELYKSHGFAEYPPQKWFAANSGYTDFLPLELEI